MRGEVLWQALCCLATSGCYAGVGPSVGIVHGEPTLGWELKAATVAVGQSYVLADSTTASRKQPAAWTRRTYVVWEPPVGTRSGRLLGGLGPTLGAAWTDNAPGSSFLTGAWLGGAATVGSGGGCDWNTLGYFSLAIGLRGGESYLTPKVGLLGLPGFCFGPSDPENNVY